MTVRYGCEFLSLRQDGGGVTARVQPPAARRKSAPLISSAATAAPARCASELGIALSGEGNLLALRQALYRCDELFDRMPIGNGPGHGRHYHVADAKSTFLIMQDSTKHWTLHSVVDSDEEMKAAFERVVGVPVKYEMLSCAPWRQNLLLADRYGKDRGVPRRRCRASRHPDRRARHEFRRRRRHRSVVEARRDAAPAGAARIC